MFLDAFVLPLTMDSSFEANINLRNKEGDYNLLAELIADKNNNVSLYMRMTEPWSFLLKQYWI